MEWPWLSSFSSRQKGGLVFLLLGSASFLTLFFLRGYQEFRARPLSFTKAPWLSQSVEEDGFPQEIVIPRLEMRLPVLPARVVDGRWEVFSQSASYLVGSGIPGQEGNTVIYAHNKNHLFGPIRWLERGDRLKVVNRKNEEFIYEVIQTKTVSPTQTEVLAPTRKKVLTLYTCTGWADRKRFILVARLKQGE